ncbi:MAG: hypothetical protein AAB802_05585 [Patescibacteria group bacterium]
MKKLFVLSLFVLALSACEMPQEETPLDETPVQEETPELTLSSGDSNIAVVTGSSCYGTMCIDKIAPWELLDEAGETYSSIENRTLTLKSDTEIDSAVFDLMDENGEGLTCDIESSKVDSKTYELTLCEDTLGEALLHMGLSFEKGSVEYYAALSL